MGLSSELPDGICLLITRSSAGRGGLKEGTGFGCVFETSFLARSGFMGFGSLIVIHTVEFMWVFFYILYFCTIHRVHRPAKAREIFIPKDRMGLVTTSSEIRDEAGELR